MTQAEMGKKSLFCRMIQVTVLLALTALLCAVALRQPQILGKGQTVAGEAQMRRNRGMDPGLPDKRGMPHMEAADSSGALYGLEGYDVPEKKLDFAGLMKDDNPHIYAWITIPGTAVDYPVLQHPDQPDYYLTHNLDGSQGYPGCIYTQPANSKDWSDNQTVIYGHNMRNGSMFAGLHGYEDERFFEENPYIYIYTEDSVRVYRIFAAYPFSDEHLLVNYDTETQKGYEEYLGLICRTASEKGHYDMDAAPENGEPIITLSTCVADKPAQRYLVQAALEAEGTRKK